MAPAEREVWIKSNDQRLQAFQSTLGQQIAGISFRWTGQSAQAVASFEECQSRCKGATSCRGLTYFKAKRLCRLMDTLTEQVKDDTAVSWVK